MVRKKRVAPPGNPLLAIGYIRVSTQEQKLGPKGQARELERWAKREGVTLAAVFVDHGVSGARPVSERPGLLAALAALPEVGAGVLLASKRDRLARDRDIPRTIESEALKGGAKVRTTDGRSDATGSDGILTKGLDDLLGEYERARISERTMAALAVKKARGERTGGVTYGFQVGPDGRTLEPNPAEQAVLVRVRELRASGVTLQAITNQLNTDGTPPRGSRWHLTTVARLVQTAE